MQICISAHSSFISPAVRMSSTPKKSSQTRSSKNANSIKLSIAEKIDQLEKYFGMPVHPDQRILQVAAGKGNKQKITFNQRINMLHEIAITGTDRGHYLKPHHDHLLYTGKISKTDKYPQIAKNRGQFRGRIRIHILVMSVFRGTSKKFGKKKFDVSHLCHNTRCARPDHLWLESHSDNTSRTFCCISGSCTKHSPRCILDGKFLTKEMLKKICKPDDRPQRPSFEQRLEIKAKHHKRHENFMEFDTMERRYWKYRQTPLALRTEDEVMQANRDLHSAAGYIPVY